VGTESGGTWRGVLDPEPALLDQPSEDAVDGVVEMAVVLLDEGDRVELALAVAWVAMPRLSPSASRHFGVRAPDNGCRSTGRI